MRGIALDVEALVLPIACLGCGRLSGRVDGRTEAGPLCAECRFGMRPIAHPKCARCGQTTDSWERERSFRTAVPPSIVPPHRRTAGVCGFCHTWPEALAWAESAVWYEDAARALVRALKYGGWRVAAGPMADVMARNLAARLRGADLLVPIPLGALRRRERGHNQAELLADALGSRAGVPVAALLARARETRTQTALHPLQRRENVQGAFVVPRESCVAGRHVVLVDDVLTTGATLGAAAEALAAAGAASIGAVTFARALKPR